jgi:LacI family fructose operon transcriptional repressor
MYLKLMREERVSGIILSPTQPINTSLIEITNAEFPVIAIDRRVQDIEIDSILIDNVESTYHVIDHLIGHGCKRIGALFGIGTTTGRERHEGYQKALSAHGIEPSKDLALYVKPREKDGYRATRQLLELPQPPDALFTSNGLLSAGSCRALRESGLKVPEEIAVATFDDTPWSTLVVPPLTVIEQPTYEIGRTAVELLVKRIQEPTRPAREITLKCRLIVRRSCGCRQ